MSRRQFQLAAITSWNVFGHNGSMPMVSKTQLWIGRVMSALPVGMLLLSAGMKLMKAPGLDQGFAHLGWPMSFAFGLGILEVVCTILYLVPATSVLGAILLTGYLGGATAAHVRVSDPYLAPPLLGALLWGGLYLRDPRLQALIPLKK